MLNSTSLTTKDRKIQTLSELNKRKKQEKEKIRNPKNNIYTNEVLKDIVSIIKGNCTTTNC
ncbi:hypothetical protein [Malaciobacter canalis]|uniref:hypothetical protein n=1 Tax=Malaciobacter canalis TaxID=1912871 RepID=UPI00384E04B3